MAKISFKPDRSNFLEMVLRDNTEDVSATDKSEFIGVKISPVNVSATDNDDAESVSATDKSRGKYKNQYTKDHYDTVRINLPKGAKARLSVSATERGVSVTNMIKEALIQYLGDEAREWLR